MGRSLRCFFSLNEWLTPMLHGYQRMKIFIESLYGSYIEFHQLNSNVIFKKINSGMKKLKKKTTFWGKQLSMIFKWFKRSFFLFFSHSLKIMINQSGLTCGHFRCMTEVRHLAGRQCLCYNSSSFRLLLTLPPRQSSSDCQSGSACQEFRNVLY